MGQSDGFFPSLFFWPYLTCSNMVGVGQEWMKAAPFPEVSRKRGFYFIPWLCFLDPRPFFKEAHCDI